MTAARVSNAAVIDPAPLATFPRASRLPKVILVALEQLVERVVQLSLEVEKCEMDARADRVSLHFSLHGHLLPHHHLFLHHHFLLHLGLTSCRASAGVGTLRRRRLARFGSPDIGIGRSDVQPGTSRRGRQKNNCYQEKLAHRRLHFDDGDSLSHAGMKLCDPDHPLPPSRDVGLVAMAVPGPPHDRWPVAPLDGIDGIVAAIGR
jgi:hypothetical protein